MNCTLVDYTPKEPVHGLPPVPVYKILIYFKVLTNPRAGEFDTIEFLSNGTYQYREAELIRDELIERKDGL